MQTQPIAHCLHEHVVEPLTQPVLERFVQLVRYRDPDRVANLVANLVGDPDADLIADTDLIAVIEPVAHAQPVADFVGRGVPQPVRHLVRAGHPGHVGVS